MNFKVTVLLVILLTILGITLGQQQNYDERCQVLEGNGVRVDQCDAKKYLACKDGRCQCADPANQIYTYLEERTSSRSKRSPGKGGKGGGFKKVAVGAGAGVVAGVATYQIAKGVDNLGGRRYNTERPSKYTKVYSCYSRVGGQCSLNLNWESVGSSTQPSSTTTTESVTTPTTEGSSTTTPTSNSTDANINATTSTTTTTAAPTPAAQIDISKIPKCVQYAVCKLGSPSSGNGTSSFLQKVDFDPRIGTCECDNGYKRTTKDLCVRDKSGATKTAGISATVILLALLVNKLLAF